jgi:hypothetical protein
MPWHFAPVLRAIEEYRESSGIYQTLDSLGVTEKKAAESAGTSPKVVPVQFVSYYEGVKYTAS